ncbi:peptidylprolyl isomerase [Lancefieldella parvula]|uniref:FKBP-type peptidyl-prolyl cis-trans isomerase n=1 Tax=Lancefieldella parvula TaxID=1382 RepID=UPI00361198C6
MSNEGKKVKVHYVGTLDDGTKFDSSRDRNEPLAFTCMAGQMIPGFDQAVKDMTVGQIVDIHIPAAEAYGERHEEAVQPVPVAQLPGSENLVAGQQVTLGTPEGYPVMATVVSNDGTIIVFDTNHPMAGKDLNFNIELLEVEE